ncbi:Phage-related tail protein [Acetobacter nitrogenifigens DSM 23921 = NBRC 105050]|uniref:Phage tail lysozyme domain-containing protein n=1 Tax=Acetobacter nitrogenifigens DSM 23921 = NBRC 105050 TaxID=1120919 RepID=A0A511X5A6_9PROT|nr:phage tail tip lysozyme [Acetobacter nitrogenifigens]GBQ92081.1 Phage-related tail protein [Acetobacter nitrogenifigens DSM 23921 = NBRC 105050]GEN58132.1 hypothetical protein ANI02nite_00160 [Acetobacter nitrogenifigens DSM 23921 = NBRC 105050]
MANQGARVVISATDRASATLEKINTRIAAIQAPVRRARAAMDRFASVTGLRTVQNGLEGVGRSALGAFRTLGQIVPVLGTITGAASVAGIYRLASAWGQAGTRLQTASRSIGMAPEKLMALQNAARLSGGTAEGMTGALEGLAQTRWEAVNGFAPEATAQFQALGISFEELRKMSPDQMFERLAKRLRAIKDPVARTIAAQKIFGGDAAGILPILQQTGDAFERNVRQAERYGLMNTKGVAAADRLRRAQEGLSEAVEGFGYSIAESLEPVIRPVVEQMSEWIAANRTWIAQDIAGYVGKFITWLRTGGWDKIKGDITGVYDAVTNVVTSLGGWKSAGRDALIAVAAIYAAPVLAGFVGLIANISAVAGAFTSVRREAVAAQAAAAAFGARNMPVAGLGGIALAGYNAWSLYQYAKNGTTPDQQDANNRSFMSLPGVSWLGKTYDRVSGAVDRITGRDLEPAYKAWQYFRGQGWSPAQASGIVANLDKESTFRPDVAGDSGRAYGLGQWHADRQAQFAKRFGHSLQRSTFDEQLQFVQYELTNGDYRSAGDALRQARTAGTAGATVSALYEKPQDQFGEMDDRARLASSWLNRLQDREGYGGNAWPAWLHDNAVREEQGDSSPVRLEISVDHKNAPPGSSVKVKSTDPRVDAHVVKQVRAMDPQNTAVGN